MCVFVHRPHAKQRKTSAAAQQVAGQAAPLDHRLYDLSVERLRRCHSHTVETRIACRIGQCH